MRKLLILLIPVVMAILVLGIVYFLFFKNEGKGALQVTSKPKSDIYLNGRLIGQTPLCRCEVATMLSSGEYTIRLVPLEGNSQPFENKITITKSVLTAVERIFSEGAGSEGTIVTLIPLQDKKKLELFVVSFPDKAIVRINNNEVGKTPLMLSDVTDSDHEIKLKKEGYKEKIIRIRTVLGYKLLTTVFLGVDQSLLEASPSASATQKTSTSSATVTILNTPTGFLRVRSNPSLSSKELTRASPGDAYEFISEKDGWFQIRLKDGAFGWISAQYAEKKE